MDYSKILKEIANPIRMKILRMLFQDNRSISEFKEKIGGISHSEISRHVGRLAKQGLITKEEIPGRNYELTYFGKTIVKFLKPLDFLLKHGEYFMIHSINHIPTSLVQDLTNLEHSDLICGTGNLLIKGKDFIEAPNKKLWVITTEPFPYDITAKEVFLIIPPKMLKYGLEVDHEATTYHVHTLEEVHLCMVISDIGQGFVFFPTHASDQPDFNSGFHVLDPKGIDYLKRIFDHFWHSSQEFVFDPGSF